MNPGSSLAETVVQDHNIVQDTLRQAATLHFSDFKLTSEQVRDWYYAVDPVFERPNELFVRMHIETNPEKQREYFNQRMEFAAHQVHTEEIGALTLLAGVVRPELPSDSWIDIIQLETGMEDEAANPDTRAARYLVKNIPEDPTLAQATDLHMALDLLNSATAFSGDLLDLHTILGPKFSDDEESITRLQEKVSDYVDITFDFAKKLTEVGMNSTDPAVRKIGFRTGLFLHAAQLERILGWHQNTDSPRSKLLLHLAEGSYFEGYLGLVEQYFLTDIPDGLRAFKGEQKGDLHEALFALDLNFLFCTNRGAYKNWVATPAFLRFDAPKYGVSALKRNCDTIIRSDKRVATAQLKAGNFGKDSPNHKPSHPNIWFLREDNFQDADIRRLGAKIHRYRQWLRTRMTDEAATQTVRAGLTESALDALERVDEMNSMTESAYQISRVPHMQLDRNARRRLARIYGELSERKRKSGR